MKINRIIFQQIEENIRPNRVVVIYGPRRVGKTTLLRELRRKYETKKKILWLNGDDLRVGRELSSQDLVRLRRFVGENKWVIIDEAQRITNIGINLKLIVDNLEGVAVIASGSASFELANKINEPLTGRKRVFYLYPFWMGELSQEWGEWEEKRRLEERLVWGSYPEVVLAPSLEEKREALMELVSSYLYRDLLEYEGIRRANRIVDLLRLLAFQVGSQVSIAELAGSLGMDFKTVEKYLDLLEKSFVIYRLGGFSRNLRKEVRKMGKYYFFDNGVRNALIESFNDLGLRNDVGQLWENWLMSERMKKRSYERIWANVYFWRTHDRQEVDLVEEREGKLYGYEFKWGERRRVKPPKDWLGSYREASWEVVTRENYERFVGREGGI